MTRWYRALLLVALVVVGLLTVSFAVRGVQHTRRLRAGSDEPIQAWMNARHIAHVYRVRPEVIWQALGLPDDQPDRRPLWRIAQAQGRSTGDLIDSVTAAINRERSAGPRGPGPPPTPPTPPTPAIDRRGDP